MNRYLPPVPHFAGNARSFAGAAPRFGDGCGPLFNGIPQQQLSCAPFVPGDAGNPATPTGQAFAQAALMAEMAQLSPAMQVRLGLNPEAIHDSVRGKNMPLGLTTGCRVVPPGSTFTVRCDVQRDGIMKRLVVPRDTAPFFAIIDLKVGLDSVFGGTCEVPAAMFTEDAVEDNIDSVTAKIGLKISLIGRNNLPLTGKDVSGNPTTDPFKDANAKTFSAGVWLVRLPRDLPRYGYCG